MSTNMPATIQELVSWCNVHESLWSTNAVQIGLSAPQALAFKNATATLALAASDAEAARQASKDKTLALRSAMDTIRTLGSANIAIIKAFAETTNNMNVYVLSGVSPNDPPSTLPEPNTPKDFTCGVNPDGSLTIKWKVSQPVGVSGVTYIVTRRVNGGDGPFTIVANEGSNKSFIDTTLPIGVDKVEYMVQPKRGMTYGQQSNIFTVQFGSVGGVGGGGMLVSTVEHAEPMKIAA